MIQLCFVLIATKKKPKKKKKEKFKMINTCRTSREYIEWVDMRDASGGRDVGRGKN